VRAQAFKELARLDDRGMLNGRGDNMRALGPTREIHALKRQVVGFASAASKNHFVSVATKQLPHLVASRLDRGFRSD
jgi:hypothetical protein